MADRIDRSEDRLYDVFAQIATAFGAATAFAYVRILGRTELEAQRWWDRYVAAVESQGQTESSDMHGKGTT